MDPPAAVVTNARSRSANVGAALLDPYIMPATEKRKETRYLDKPYGIHHTSFPIHKREEDGVYGSEEVEGEGEKKGTKYSGKA